MNIGDILKNLLTSLVGKPREGIIVILVVLVAYQYTINRQKIVVIDNLNKEKTELINQLNQKIEMGKNNITVTTKDKNTGEIKKKTTYVPPEGKVEIIMDQSNSMVYDQPSQVAYVNAPPLGATTGYLIHNYSNVATSVIKVTDKGFCFRPGIGALYDFDKQELKAQLDIKFGFVKRFSGIASFDKEYGSIAITRHIDDVFKTAKNLEIGIYAGLKYDASNSRITIGVRSNF